MKNDLTTRQILGDDAYRRIFDKALALALPDAGSAAQEDLSGPKFGASLTLYGNTRKDLWEKRVLYQQLLQFQKEGALAGVQFLHYFRKWNLVDIFYVDSWRKSIPW